MENKTITYEQKPGCDFLEPIPENGYRLTRRGMDSSRSGLDYNRSDSSTPRYALELLSGGNTPGSTGAIDWEEARRQIWKATPKNYRPESPEQIRTHSAVTAFMLGYNTCLNVAFAARKLYDQTEDYLRDIDDRLLSLENAQTDIRFRHSDDDFVTLKEVAELAGYRSPKQCKANMLNAITTGFIKVQQTDLPSGGHSRTKYHWGDCKKFWSDHAKYDSVEPLGTSRQDNSHDRKKRHGHAIDKHRTTTPSQRKQLPN